jgi:hypothetical protein
MKYPYKNSSVTVQFPSISFFYNKVETKTNGLFQDYFLHCTKHNRDNLTAGFMIEKALWIKNSGVQCFKIFSSSSNGRVGIKFVNYFGRQIVSINLL